MLDVGILANLLLGAGITLHATFNVRSVLERSAKFFLLFRAVRAPVGAIHHDVSLLEALRKFVVTMRLVTCNTGHDCKCQQN